MESGGQSGGQNGPIEFSERWLEGFALGPGEDRAKHWDSKVPGLGVIFGRRRVSFIVQHRVKGEQRSVTIGHWAPSKLRALDAAIRNASLTLLQARGKAITVLGQMRSGVDPRGEDAPQAQPVSPTLRAALELHLGSMRKAEASARGIKTIESETKKYLEHWLDRPLHEITRTDCRELHDDQTKTKGPYVANRVMRHLRAIWNTCLKEHDLPANPTIAVQWNKEHRRQEPIPWSKLAEWRTALDSLSEIRRDYNLVVLLTGIRRMDAATIRREHVDLKAKTLHRPNPKGGEDRAFTIPISKECADVFKRRLANNVLDEGWIFPTDSLKDRECAECQALGLPNHKAGTRTHLMEPKEDADELVSPHRLRDTYTTALGALDPPVSGFVIDVLTNHRPPRGSVTAGYIDLTADDLRKAQQRVSKFLTSKMKDKKKPKHRRR